MNKPASSFEKRYLFGYGRHFWNALGVVGFTVMATGAVYAIQGLYGLRDTASKVNPVFSEWVCSEEHHSFFNEENNISPNPDGLGKQKGRGLYGDCWAYDLWIRGTWYNVRDPDFRGSKGNRRYNGVQLAKWEADALASHTALLEQEQKQEEEKFAASVRLGLSPIIAGAGLVVVAVSSVVSAVLAIERNTRQ